MDRVDELWRLSLGKGTEIMTMKEKTKIIAYCLGVLILNSCAFRAPELSTNNALQTTPMHIATLESYPTPISIYKYQDQVTDGNLLFSVEEKGNNCHKIGDPVYLIFTITNLTDHSINILKDFSIASGRYGDDGNIFPFITSSNGEDVFSRHDVEMSDYFSFPSEDYFVLSDNQVYEFLIEYHFPYQVAQELPSGKNKIVTPSTGFYFLRFIYLEYEREIDTWFGAIGSNRIKVCFVD